MAVRYPVLPQPRAEPFTDNRVPKPAYFRGDTTVQPVMYIAGELIHRAGQAHSGKTAAVFCEENVSWTYQRLDEEVTRLAANLYDVGLRPTDRVGVFMSNYSPVFLLSLAAARLGAVVVMLHPTFLAHELEHALQLTQCKALVVQPSHKTTDCIQMLLQLLPKLEISDPCAIKSARFPSLASVFVADCRGVGAAGYHSLCPTDWRSIPGLTCFNTFVAGPINPATVKTLENLAVKPTDPLCILFTSGSTDRPKAVTMTHYSVLNSAYFNGRTAGMTNRDVICLPMPLTHCTGLVGGLFTTLTAGGTLVFPGSVYTSEATLRAIQAYQCNITFGVGSMYIDQICHPKFNQFDLSSLRCGIIGGSNCPPSVKANIIHRLHLARLLTAYGMSGKQKGWH
ncbi:hypothetical protein H4R35_006248 [Dimargaris xerosporica]|nr:hypothetical protein H4R35_006248 [Dimargaris xerosporica]